MTAFILDPSKFSQKVLENILEPAGIKSVPFDDADDLLTVAAQGTQPCDLICVALKLGQVSGSSLAQELRKVPAAKHVPIVLITSTDSQAEVENALNAGVTEVFYKSDLHSFQHYVFELKKRLLTSDSKCSTILYVEDSKATAELIMSWFAKSPIKLVHALSAESALEMFKSDPAKYDLVYTDFHLAGKMTGLGLIREIRANQGFRVPILVSSGMDDEGRKLEILRSGANDYIPKPVVEEELKLRVKLQLEHKSMVDELDAMRFRVALQQEHDPLTGTLLRSEFLAAAPGVFEQSGLRETAFIAVDIDGCSAANAIVGFSVMDKQLVALGKTVRKYLPQHAIVLRLGADSFGALIPQCTLAKASNLGEEIRIAFEEGERVSKDLTLSIGVAVVSGGPEMLETVMGAAEEALSSAKTRGGNRTEQASH